MARTIQISVLTGLVILVAIGLRIAFTWTSLELLPATSDEASSVLLAKDIASGERPLLFSGQPYQFPLESYLMAPFIDWMPMDKDGYTIKGAQKLLREGRGRAGDKSSDDEDLFEVQAPQSAAVAPPAMPDATDSIDRKALHEILRELEGLRAYLGRAASS